MATVTRFFHGMGKLPGFVCSLIPVSCDVLAGQGLQCHCFAHLVSPKCHSGSWGQDKPLTMLCSLSFGTLEPKSSSVLSFQLLWKGWNPASLHSLMQCDGLRALAGDCASPLTA